MATEYTDDNTGDVNSDGDDNIHVEDKLPRVMSLYRVKNSTLGIQGKFTKNENELESIIEKKLAEENNLEYHKLDESESKPFRLCLLTNEDKIQGSTAVHEQVAKQRGAEKKKFNKALRTGCVIVFFRILPTKIPEIFILNSGFAITPILRHVDIDFRTEMIKRYLRDANIKAYSYLSLTGPDIKTAIELRSNIEGFFKQSDFFGKILTEVKGEIEPESDLGKCINEGESGGSKTVRIEFGTYMVKLLNRFSFKQWTDILKTVSEDMKKMPSKISLTQLHIIEAFESVQKIDDLELLKKLENKMNEEMVRVISQNISNTDLYLCTSRPHDFMQAYSFELKIQKGKHKKFDDVESWVSSPSLQEVARAIRDRAELVITGTGKSIKEKVIEDLNEERIQFKFDSRQEPLQTLIQGMVAYNEDNEESGKYFRLGKLWYKLSSTCIDRIETDFKQLAKNVVSEYDTTTTKTLLNVLKYRWSFSKVFTANVLKEGLRDIVCKEEIPYNDVIDILLDDVQLLKKKKSNLFRCDNMFLIPLNAELVRLVTKARKASKPSNEELNETETVNYIRDLTDSQQRVKSGNGLEFIKCQVLSPTDMTPGSTETTYEVSNPILSVEQSDRLKSHGLTDDNITDILSRLRSLMPLSEGEYNELYLHSTHPGYDVIVGDRVFVKYVELFDILIHAPTEKITYLVHNKDGFDKAIRVACSQIRVSAELLWNDYIKGDFAYVEKWLKAAKSSRTTTQYRIQLKNKLEKKDKEMMRKYFANDVEVVFVLGFRHETKELLKNPQKLGSTIAKLELLTLFSHFSKFQVGGWRKFSLKIMQLKSDYPMKDGAAGTKRKSNTTPQNLKQTKLSRLFKKGNEET